MKQLIDIFLILLSLFLLSACSIQTTASPSQNSALNTISTSTADTQKGSLQKTLDDFLENDWDKTMQKDKKIQKKYSKKKERNFTLQEYVDKATAYKKAHPSDYEHSNVHKLESMPIIGKQR